MVIKRLDMTQPYEVYASMRAKEQGGIVLYADNFAIELSTENLLDIMSVTLEQIQEKANNVIQCKE